MAADSILFPDKDMVGLYHAIEPVLSDVACPVIHFASCYKREGTTQISLRFCQVISALPGHRALFIDIHARHSLPAIKNRVSLIEVANAKAPLTEAVVACGINPQLDYAYLEPMETRSEILMQYDRMKEIFLLLRNQYRMIILHSSAMLTDPAAIALSRLADGVVLVVEAEQTRAPAAQKAIQLLSEKGIKIFGLVFNKRRYYIPAWLYRWL